MLVYEFFRFSVRDAELSSGGEVHVCAFEMSAIHELYNLDFNAHIPFTDNRIDFAHKTGLEQKSNTPLFMCLKKKFKMLVSRQIDLCEVVMVI